jgi:hypothetical protein
MTRARPEVAEIRIVIQVSADRPGCEANQRRSMDSTERFALDWIGKKIDDVPVVPTKSQDLYAFYREWSAALGYSHHAPGPRFLAEIAKRGGIRKSQARYLNGSSTRQARFLFPPGVDQPVEMTQPEWLAKCITDFRAGVEEWKKDRIEM